MCFIKITTLIMPKTKNAKNVSVWSLSVAVCPAHTVYDHFFLFAFFHVP